MTERIVAMAENNTIDFTKEDLSKLEHLSDLLHLFHHRNKNQHRRSIWWRHFSTFRKQLNALVYEIQSLHEVPATHLQRSRKKTQDRETKATVTQRIEFWREVLVPKWHASFSQTVADGRFSVLGLVLIAVLAQSCQIVGISSGVEDEEMHDAEEALQDLTESTEASSIKRANTPPPPSGEDLGEVVKREQVGEKPKDEVAPQETPSDGKTKAQRREKIATKSDPPRKKRKKANAIDDLFSSLS